MCWLCYHAFNFVQRNLRSAHMTSRQARFQEDTYFRVMKMVQAQPDISQRQLAQALGLSLGGVNYCLQALMEKGWVKVQNFSSSKNKLGYAYLLTPTGVTEKTALTARFLKRKMHEYAELRAEIEALQKESVIPAAPGERKGDAASGCSLPLLAGEGRGEGAPLQSQSRPLQQKQDTEKYNTEPRQTSP